MIKLRGLGPQGVLQVEQRGVERSRRALQGKAYGGGDVVVRRLPPVDAVVGMDGPVDAARTAAEQLVGAVGEDLVGVHVVRGAGAGLEGVDPELVAVGAAQDFVGGAHDDPGLVGPKQPELAIDLRGGLLDEHDAVDQLGPRRQPRDGEVLYGALGLNAVQGVLRHLLVAQRVVLKAHDLSPLRGPAAPPFGRSPR